MAGKDWYHGRVQHAAESLFTRDGEDLLKARVEVMVFDSVNGKIQSVTPTAVP